MRYVTANSFSARPPNTTSFIVLGRDAETQSYKLKNSNLPPSGGYFTYEVRKKNKDPVQTWTFHALVSCFSIPFETLVTVGK